MSPAENLEKYKIGVVIPYYNASKHINNVLNKLPSFIHKIYIVNDKSPDNFSEELIKESKNFEKVCIVNHEKNLGVGGATKTGFYNAIQDELDYLVKVDSDDQMDTTYIKELIESLISTDFGYAKGNRFRDFKALKSMPKTRKIGNLGLSFLTKVATGYWNNFDPTNGFFAIKVVVLKELDLESLSNRYYFETSLIAELYFHKIRIKDIPMPAIYGDEKSSMKVWKMPFVFMPRLTKTFFKRIIRSYYIYDFNISSIYMLLGVPLFLFGFIFGVYTWWYYASKDVLAPTGTIMLVTLTIIIGFQLLLQSVHYDVIKAPKSHDE